MRKENNGTRYFSFDEVAQEVYNIAPPSSTLRNPTKRDELVAKLLKEPIDTSSDEGVLQAKHDLLNEIIYDLKIIKTITIKIPEGSKSEEAIEYFNKIEGGIEVWQGLLCQETFIMERVRLKFLRLLKASAQ